MRRLLLAIAVLVLVMSVALTYRPSPEKPPLWGLSDPPALSNFTWENRSGTEVLALNSSPRLYGVTLEELRELGYTLVSGNWSSRTCQWSYWTSGARAYYVAYNGTRFVAVRGDPYLVLETAQNITPCNSGGTAVPTAGPWKTAEETALSLITLFLENNVTVSPANWTGPLPDWYLAKFSFRANIGDGVEVLILVYANDEQAKYAEEFLEGTVLRTEGEYYVLIVLRGRKADVNRAVSIIQGT